MLSALKMPVPDLLFVLLTSVIFHVPIKFSPKDFGVQVLSFEQDEINKIMEQKNKLLKINFTFDIIWSLIILTNYLLNENVVFDFKLMH